MTLTARSQRQKESGEKPPRKNVLRNPSHLRGCSFARYLRYGRFRGCGKRRNDKTRKRERKPAKSSGDHAMNPFVNENVSDHRSARRLQPLARRLIARLQFPKFLSA